MNIDEMKMDFKSPAKGGLVITGGHEPGDMNYFLKVVSELSSEVGLNKRTITFVGDAETGVITGIRPEGGEAKADVPEIDWATIQNHLAVLGTHKVNQLQRDGFAAFSAGKVTIPTVVHMNFPAQGGDLHMKGAHAEGGSIYVFKIATGFPNNKDKGISTHQGLMIAFDAKTGDPIMVLKDQGNLTDLRTAISGRNAAEILMAPKELTGIGMLGTGVQARQQVEQLESLYPNCRDLTVWGRTTANTEKYANDMRKRGWSVTIVDNPRAVADAANLIITTTPTESALLDANDITNPNTLIVAIGADMPGKVELTPTLLKKASNVVIDSIIQGKHHGNAADAIKTGVISEDDLQEFGDLVTNGLRNPELAKSLRIFLSSGIGVQDLQIVEAVIKGSMKKT
jgi:ornithine cyclodeaminase